MTVSVAIRSLRPPPESMRRIGRNLGKQSYNHIASACKEINRGRYVGAIRNAARRKRKRDELLHGALYGRHALADQPTSRLTRFRMDGAPKRASEIIGSRTRDRQECKPIRWINFGAR